MHVTLQKKESAEPVSIEPVRTVREAVDAAARRNPTATFLINPQTREELSFQDLQKGLICFADLLRREGLERGDNVAFLMDNDISTIQIFLGAMYGGFVSVPLNVRAGVSQLSYVLNHSDAKVVFVAAEYATLAEQALNDVPRAIKKIVLTPEADELYVDEGSIAKANSHVPPEPDDVALLMYTSGSTGNPKAAVHSHRTIIAHGANSVAAHQLSSMDRSLLVLPLYHINAECVTLIPTLLSGGSVVVPKRFAVSQFWEWMGQYECTWSAVVPTIISQLLDLRDTDTGRYKDTFGRIRFLRSSSAPLAPSLQREFLSKFDVLLIQAMGSSEAGNIFSNPLPPRENKIGSPGLPWGFETRIIDQDGRELPAGESGEVVIRGPAVMQSYYKDPIGTAKALSSDGWFRTGDIAYRDEDGYFFMVGRSKELIIKGGVNIAPRQIDDILESHPAVLEAAAVGVPDEHLGEDIVAFVALRSDSAANETNLLEFCEARLGHFKTPTRIYFAKDLPKGPSGKVQRLRLSDEAIRLANADARGTSEETLDSVVQSTTSLERGMLEIWAELLKAPQLTVDDNFFMLGGDSLLAIQCLSRLRDKLPVRITLSEFFENGSIAQQAALINKRLYRTQKGVTPRDVQKQSEITNAPTIPRRASAGPYRLSPSQERIWFMEELNSGVPVYNEAEAVRLKGSLNVEALEKAFNAVVARHEMLRSTIESIDGQPMVVPHENWPLRLKVIDISTLANSEKEVELERLLVDEPRAPYHLDKEPAIRATLVRLSASEHALILMMHHLICDWASEGVLWRETAAFYGGFCRGEAAVLPTLAIDHGDYAVWQRQQLTDARLAEDLAFWVENLKQAPALLDIPSDRPRPQIMSYRGARRQFRVDSTLTESLREISRNEKKSLFAVFTAALDALLYRYTGSTDVLLAVPISERDVPDLGSMIGFLLHTHALRTNISGDITFHELLARVQKGALDLYEHRSVPFDQVVRAVQPERNLSYSPLSQVLVNWRDRDQHLSFIGLEGLQVEPLLAETKTSKFDLTFMMTDMGDEIWVELEYSTDLFDEATILRMFGHYKRLLECVTSDVQQHISELAILTDKERREVLVDWNQTGADYPDTLTICDLFEAQAKRTPANIAVEFGDTRLTYSDLSKRSTDFARCLRAMGVGPNDLVGVFMERSLEMPIALLGILKTQAAYLPLDVNFPSERIQSVLEDAKPPILVTLSKLLTKLPLMGARVVCVDAFETPNAAIPLQSGAPDQLAYVIYTSGSTGKPKGVKICHKSVVNFLSSMLKVPGISQQDALLSVTTLSFDIFGLELWLPLTAGARVVIAPDVVTKDGWKLAALIQSSGATVMQATPSTWRLLIDCRWQGEAGLKVLCGGEAWPPQLADELLSRCGSLWNMYGPTETTIWSAVSEVAKGKPITIGHPVDNTQFYIVDSHSRPVPVGIPGELLIGGDGLSQGYLNRSDLTAEKFIRNPFDSDPTSRVYRTGDMVRYRADGSLDFLGRTDQQVKIRGFRIELGEIENVLLAHPGVDEAAVIVRGETEKQLAAYVVKSEQADATISDLRTHVRQKLPEYMIPAVWVYLPELPLTPNGKLDRKALSTRSMTDAETMGFDGFEAAATDTEKQLARVWSDVLGLEKVGIHDGFFELGGHSLLAVSLNQRIETVFGMRFPLTALLQAPTIAQYAQLVDRHLSLSQIGEQNNSKTIADQVRRFVIQNYLDGAGEDLHDEDSLFERQIVDPLRFEELIAFLEETYGIVIGEHTATAADFDSVSNIATFVREKINERSGADERTRVAAND